MRDTKVLVTGGCGFIGCTLVRLLQQRGVHVRVLDNLSRGFRSYVGPQTELLVGDIRDPEAVARAMTGIDAVVHLAAYGSVIESISDPRENFDINVRGTLTVLEGARDAGVERLVFASTGGAIMGDTAPPVDETSVPRPISPYGSSKLCGEAYCHGFAGSYGLRTIMLRFGNVYGPWSAHKKGAVTTFAKALLQDQPITIFGDGSASRDLLHVSDLCSGIMAALEVDVAPASVFHLASGQETTVGELARLMAELAGKPDHPITHKPARKGEVLRNFAAFERARQVLGFQPSYGLKDGMLETWAWFRDHRDEALAVEATDS